MTYPHILREDDIRELNWLADVLEAAGNGDPVDQDGARELANLLRSKLPRPRPRMRIFTEVYDRNGYTYRKHGDRWYLIKDGQALEVAYGSILDPEPVDLFEVVG